jgi:hypothetical protein
VVDAGEATLLVSAKEQLGAPMWAMRSEDSDPALRIPKGNQVLSEEPKPQWVAVGCDFP